MFYLHFYNISSFSCSRFSYLWILALILPLAACSGNSADSAGTGPDLNTPVLSWVAPSEREDGSGLSLSEIARFRVYYGTSSGDYSDTIDINDNAAVQMALVNIPSGTFFIAITAVDADGLESTYSTEVIVTQ